MRCNLALIGPEAGIAGERAQNQGPQGPGPQGGFWVLGRDGQRGRSHVPPTPGPAGLPGPASLYMGPCGC